MKQPDQHNSALFIRVASDVEKTENESLQIKSQRSETCAPHDCRHHKPESALGQTV